jgi:hypothetical protein
VQDDLEHPQVRNLLEDAREAHWKLTAPKGFAALKVISTKVFPLCNAFALHVYGRVLHVYRGVLSDVPSERQQCPFCSPTGTPRLHWKLTAPKGFSALKVPSFCLWSCTLIQNNSILVTRCTKVYFIGHSSGMCTGVSFVGFLFGTHLQGIGTQGYA